MSDGDHHDPHGHEHFGPADAASLATREGSRATWISLAILALTAAVQLAIFAASGSVALLADTIHNATDALTAIPLLIAFRLARRPPTRRYPYGYHRAEDVAGLAIVGLIGVSALAAAAEAVDRLVHPQPLDAAGWVLAAGVLGLVGNEAVAQYRIRVGRRIGSAALVADGLHARTDGLTSLGVVIATLGVLAGFERADAVVALAITVPIGFTMVHAARAVLHRALDGTDESTLALIEAVAGAVDGRGPRRGRARALERPSAARRPHGRGRREPHRRGRAPDRGNGAIGAAARGPEADRRDRARRPT